MRLVDVDTRTPDAFDDNVTGTAGRNRLYKAAEDEPTVFRLVSEAELAQVGTSLDQLCETRVAVVFWAKPGQLTAHVRTQGGEVNLLLPELMGDRFERLLKIGKGSHRSKNKGRGNQPPPL